jgi:poly(3-hydroxyalkanoate) depolymerase
MTMPTVACVELGDTRLRYSVAGSGPPLLLTSGIGASLELTEPFRAALDGRSTIAWDAPGAGESDVPRGRPSLRRVAGYAVALLDELGLKQADVMGLSWGGLVAQELARRHPSRVRRLVLAATGTGWTSVPGDVRVLPILLNTRRYTSPRFLEEMGPRLYGGDVRTDPEILRRQAALRLLHPPSTGGYWWQLLATAGWTSVHWLHRLPHRTLVLAADDDPIAHLANARLLAHAIPDARLEVIEGGGHLFAITRPDETARLVERFLAEPDEDA